MLRPWHVDDHNLDSELRQLSRILRSVRSVHFQHRIDGLHLCAMILQIYEVREFAVVDSELRVFAYSFGTKCFSIITGIE
jgi:hypothetical protein